MIEVALMFCFPVVEDVQGYIRMGNPVTVSQELHHGQILHALKLGGVPSDSYICTPRLIDRDALNQPAKEILIYRSPYG